jgi:hypothetical protein
MPGSDACHKEEERHPPLRDETDESHQQNAGLLVFDVVGHEIEDSRGVKKDQPQHEQRSHRIDIAAPFGFDVWRAGDHIAKRDCERKLVRMSNRVRFARDVEE